MSTHCSLEGPQSNRRQLTSDTYLNIVVTVNDASSAMTQANSFDFVSSLGGLPQGVSITNVSTPGDYFWNKFVFKYFEELLMFKEHHNKKIIQI